MTATKKTTKPKTTTAKPDPLAAMQAQIDALIEQNKILQAQLAAGPKVVHVSNDTERVRFLWIAPVADDNEFLVGENGMYGKITGKVGTFSVPKSDLSRILDPMFMRFMERRWVIVLDGLTDEERVQYGVDYKPGEVFERNTFLNMFHLGDAIADVYSKLCDSSREMMAKLYHEAYFSDKKKDTVSRSAVVKMNKIAPQPGFRDILDAMNKAETE